MQTSKVEIPANPTSRDKGNGVDDLAEHAKPAALIASVANEIPPRDHEPEPGVFVAEDPKEPGDGKRRR